MHGASAERTRQDTVIVLGSGPIRIGQGIEFDYSSVHCVRTLKQLGYDVVIINNNPETVSTDYDTADRLYFEPLTPEDVMGVIEVEKPVGVVVAFGGQTAINLTEYPGQARHHHPGHLRRRHRHGRGPRAASTLCWKTCTSSRPKGMSVHNLEEALVAAEKLGYPRAAAPLLRHRRPEHGHCPRRGRRARSTWASSSSGGIENPVLVDKYMPGTELEVDVISDGTDVLMPGIMEHIERAGVHSGDSIAVYPPYNLTDKMMQIVVDCSEKLALALGTKGLVNIQYLVYEGELYRHRGQPPRLPHHPLYQQGHRRAHGGSGHPHHAGRNAAASWAMAPVCASTPPYYAVKVPVFSFEKLTDANAVPGP